MKEFEYKTIICKEKFNEIRDFLNSQKIIKEEKIQVNYYFDNEHFDLKKQNITLRVRQQGDNLKMQLKSKISNKSALIESEEEEFDVKKLPNRINLEKYNIFADYMGNLVTIRNRYYIEDGIVIDLDENHYLGNHDFEIEIEYEKCLQHKIRDIINSLNLIEKIDTKSKSVRFFEVVETFKI